MSADSLLNKHQWPTMAMDRILRLPSSDAPPGGTVADVLPRKEAEVSADPHGDFGRLRESMHDHGQRWPIHIDESGVGNGHHRIAVARQLGWTQMAYSPDIEDTGEEFADLPSIDNLPGIRR